MKQIEFGYSNDVDPKGSHEGMGIRPGLLLTDADYYGSIMFEGDYFIVAKVVEDEFNHYPQLLDKFIVRQALCDLYPDGSTILMLNQEETELTRMLEQHLNDPQIKDRITSLQDIINSSSEIHRSSPAFILGEIECNGKVLSTSITPEAFERKNSAIKSCHHSISYMQQELESCYESISSMKQEQNSTYRR